MRYIQKSRTEKLFSLKVLGTQLSKNEEITMNVALFREKKERSCKIEVLLIEDREGCRSLKREIEK